MESIYMNASQTREFVVKLRLTTPKARLKVSTYALSCSKPLNL